ncbi:hypothetical protein EDB83DRAFT_1466003 [Lactarius deliciosus]|nr:hypothetical protein EDB83DRAFT_1466003 [Lactarius deliciosus]
MRSQSSPRMPQLRASCRHHPPPNTVPPLTTTHRTSLSRIVSRIRLWRLGACQRRSIQAHYHRSVWPSGVNASQWLSGKASSSPSVPGTDSMARHVLFAHVDARQSRHIRISPRIFLLRTRRPRESALLCSRLWRLYVVLFEGSSVLSSALRSASRAT